MMFITAAGMAVVLGMGSMAIDTAQWYQKRHAAQLSADAAALAAANCLANAGSGSTCTSTTDTTDASKVATTIATDNGIPISGVSYSSTQVTVTTATTAPETFAEVFKIADPPVSQTAVANYAAGHSTKCDSSSQVVGDCLAIFGLTNVCGVDTGNVVSDIGVSIPANGVTLKGAVHSNASLFGGSGNNFGPGTLGSQCGLSPLYDYFSSGANLFSGSSNPVGQAVTNTWPIDYSADFPPCGGAGAPCNSSGTPSFCSQSAASFSFTALNQPAAGYIYCAYGTGTKSDPSTWNGNISMSGGGFSGTQSNPTPDTFVGGSVTMNGTYYFESCGYSSSGYTAANCKGASGQSMPAPPLCSSSSAPSPCNYPLIYATDNATNAPACNLRLAVSVCIAGGASDWEGDIFASSGDALPPNGSGTVYLVGGSQSTTFVEAYNVLWVNGNAIGDGPTSTSGTTTTAGTDSLAQ
jgi:hypothetical protein